LEALLFVLRLLQGERVKIQFGSRKGGKELVHDPLIHGIGPEALAHRNLILAAEVGAQVLRAAFVLDGHLMTALPTVDDALQQRFAGPRHAARAVAIVFAVIVLQHGLDLLESLPRNKRRILVPQAYLPLFHRQAFLQLLAILPGGLGTAADISSG